MASKKSSGISLQFVKITRKDGKELKEIIMTWDEVSLDDVSVVCQNFFDGFLYAVDCCSDLYLIRPYSAAASGWNAHTRLFSDGTGFMYRFEDAFGLPLTLKRLQNY